MVSIDSRQHIAETLALHAYVTDENQLGRLEELFTPDAVYDMTRSGMGAFEGIDVIRVAAGRLAASGQAPRAHFVTNVLVVAGDEESAVVRSRGLMIMQDGSLHAVTYDDTFRLHDGRWLISHRLITPIR